MRDRPHVGNAGYLRHAYLAKEKVYPRQAQGQGGTREHQGKEKQTKEHRKRQKPKEKTGPGSQKGQEGGPETTRRPHGQGPQGLMHTYAAAVRSTLSLQPVAEEIVVDFCVRP